MFGRGVDGVEDRVTDAYIYHSTPLNAIILLGEYE